MKWFASAENVDLVLQQWEDAGRNAAEAARRLNMPVETFKSRLQRAKQFRDPAIEEAKRAVNTHMTPRLAWVKTKNDDGTSHSVLLKPEELPDDTLERIREAFEGMQPAPPAAAPEATMADLLTVWPLYDFHLGQYSWGKETGGPDYNIDQARDDLVQAFEAINAHVLPSDTAVLIIGGDAFHADDNTAETPAHRHKLDVDGRHYKVLDSGVQVIAYLIDALRAKHRDVIVRVMRGNHDEHSHLILTFAIAERYRDEPRVTVEKTPRDLFMLQWGKTSIFARHGDKMKPEQMAHMIADICPFWSLTRHRYAFTGHVHHERARDIGGLKWESLRAFAPLDQYAASMGFTTRRGLRAMTFSKAKGRVITVEDPIE